MDWKFIRWYLYPLMLFVLLVLLSLTQTFQLLDMRLYDLMLKVRPEPVEDDRILLVEIDDATIGDVGSYPLGRDVIADGAQFFWEYQAEYVIFDSQFIDTSPRGIDESWLKSEIPRTVSVGLDDVEGYGAALADSLASGRLPSDSLNDYLEEYQAHTRDTEDRILEAVSKVILDKDRYLGDRVALLRNGIVTVGIQDVVDPYVSDERRREALKFALSPVTILDQPAGQAVDIRPSIIPISNPALALGFPRVNIDDDGVRRRIDLVFQWEDSLFPQLGLAMLTQLLSPESYALDKKHFTMENITWPDGETQKELAIPLSRDGRMFINWPHKKFQDSFRHFSFRNLYVQNVYEASLMDNLKQLESWGILGMYGGENPLPYLEYAGEYVQSAIEDPEAYGAEEYRQIRDAGFQALQDLANSSLEQEGLAEIRRLLDTSSLADGERESLEDLSAALPLLMENLRELVPELISLRQLAYEQLRDSLVILGYSGESTQDIGVTPFDNHYMNMGLHGAVINTVLQRDFIDDIPFAYSILIGFFLSFILSIILRRGNDRMGILLAFATYILFFICLVLVFRVTGVYPGVLFPLLSSVFCSVMLLGVKFLRENREKGFIKNAFGQYLSSEVVDSIIKDPSKLNLGGAEKELTAIFTDLKGFSTISEQLSPSQLVQLLNRYLTAMSDIVLDNKGTIDKFEGDAIIAFFGAPHELKHHASAGLISALQMKQIENQLNEEFRKSDPPRTPSPLLTRVGVNTGRMVVGNMGTLRKMDYTIMGSAVNLAARLEGVNKQYNTWIITSHYSYEQAKRDIVARPLDQVRVVGINEPVQLYQVMAEKAQANGELKEQIDYFNRNMELFRQRKWKEAQREFRSYYEAFPFDETVGIYLKRLETYLRTPPPDNWDGVYNLTKK